MRLFTLINFNRRKTRWGNFMFAFPFAQHADLYSFHAYETNIPTYTVFFKVFEELLGQIKEFENVKFAIGSIPTNCRSQMCKGLRIVKCKVIFTLHLGKFQTTAIGIKTRKPKGLWHSCLNISIPSHLNPLESY